MKYMGFFKAGSVSALPPGSMMTAVVDGLEIALCNTGEGIYAIGNTCPHAGGPLSEGALHGKTVVCPWHAWEYDCSTGKNDFDPEVAVPVYPVSIAGDDILIDISTTPGPVE